MFSTERKTKEQKATGRGREQEHAVVFADRRLRLSPFFCLLPFAFCLLFAGCRQQMGQQPKYRPLEGSGFFDDGRSARQPVRGTVSRSLSGKEIQNAAYKQGGTYTNDFPYKLTPELLARGRERYEIDCAVCHGLAGYGDGMIVKRGFSPPPSYHRDDVRNQPVGFYFDVITNGYGAMASYAAQVSEQDRWAIIAYIRALQLSQRAAPDDVPPEVWARFVASNHGTVAAGQTVDGQSVGGSSQPGGDGQRTVSGGQGR
jgi:mono/diheme cytochrome c family protein